jgi:hypothetical protein
MRVKPPKFRRTHEFFRGLAEHVSYGVIAQKCGKELQTAEAWGREPESNDNPNGTGKRNVFDTYLRLLGMAHEKNPGLARDWASVGVEYVDYLDGKMGRETTLSVCELAAIYVKEQADVIAKILANGDTEGLWKEMAECEAAFNQLKACIREQSKVVPQVREFAASAVKERAA